MGNVAGATTMARQGSNCVSPRYVPEFFGGLLLE